MTTFYYIRHAETELNVQPNIVGGRSNHANLTELGRTQAEKFGTWLGQSDITPDVVYISPTVRTWDTAQLVLDHANIAAPVHIDDRLQELAQGVKEGANRAETYTDEVLETLHSDPMNFKFEGGESVSEVQARMLESFDDMRLAHPNATILVVSHGLAIRSHVGRLTSLPHHDIIRVLTTPNVSATHITTDGDDVTVHYTGRALANLELLNKEQYT